MIKQILLFTDPSPFGRCKLICDQWQLSKSNQGGLFVGHRNRGDHGMPLEIYEPARGTQGVSGSPIEAYHLHYCTQYPPVRKIDCYTKDFPYLLDSDTKIGPFKSKAWVAQLVISSDAEQGMKPELDIHIGLLVE